jgi:hypothetical protein
MPTVKIPEIEVIYKGTFVLLSLYRVIRKWLQENEYYDDKSDPSEESSMEQLYLERRGTAQRASEKEWRIWWRTQKPTSKMSKSNYYTYHMDVTFNVIQSVDMEIMREGKKEIVQAGELRLLIEPYIDLKDMSKHPIIKYIDFYFRTRIIKKNLDEHRKIIYQDAYKLEAYIKRYMDMMSFLPEEQIQHKKFEFV